MDLEKIFEDEYNAYSEIKHLIDGKVVKESMPCMSKEKFIEVVKKLTDKKPKEINIPNQLDLVDEINKQEK